MQSRDMRDQVLIIHCGCLVVGIYSFYILSIEWAYIWNTVKLNILMPMILEKIGEHTNRTILKEADPTSLMIIRSGWMLIKGTSPFKIA